MKSRFPYETRIEMRIMGRIGQKQRMERVLALDISGKHLHNKIVASTAQINQKESVADVSYDRL